MKLKCIAVLAAGLLALSACKGGLEVTQSSYGDDWPFTVESGTLKCEKTSAAVFSANGVDYGLNGIASSHGYAELRPIWRDNPSIPGTKVNIGDFIKLALDQC